MEAVTRVAEKKGVTPAQIALGWLLSRKPWIVPIPGTTKLHRLEENLGGADVALSSGDLDEIQGAVQAIDIQGHRYGEASQRMVNR